MHIISVIIRGVVTGTVIGSLTALLLFLWYKFTPDTDTQQSASYSQTAGENVNITIDDTDTVLNVSGTEEQGVQTSVPIVNTDTRNVASGGAEPPISSESADSAMPRNENGTFDENAELSNSQEDIGELPSMDEFMPENTAVSDTASYDSDASPDLTSSFSVSEIQATDADTKVMAQAIRTILQSGE